MKEPISFVEEYYIQRGKAVFWRTTSIGLAITIVIILWII